MLSSLFPLLLSLSFQGPLGPGDVLPADVPERDEASFLSSIDPRFRDRVRIVYWPGDEGRAERVLETIEEFSGLPGIPEGFPRTATFVLTPDQERWRALTGGEIPPWGGGVAIPSRQMAVLPLHEAPVGGLASRDRTTLHEWAHLGLHEYLEGLRIPRWFDEGYAQWASGGWDLEEVWRLRIALARGGAPPLDSLTLSWPEDESAARIAYMLSASAVEYLLGESGERGAAVFLERWRETGDFETAFRSTFAMTSTQFERRWVDYAKEKYGWMVVLSQVALFWILGGLLLIPLARAKRRRRIEMTARLRALDPPPAPAYWDPEREVDPLPPSA